MVRYVGLHHLGTKWEKCDTVSHWQYHLLYRRWRSALESCAHLTEKSLQQWQRDIGICNRVEDDVLRVYYIRRREVIVSCVSLIEKNVRQ